MPCYGDERSGVFSTHHQADSDSEQDEQVLHAEYGGPSPPFVLPMDPP